MTSRLHHTNGQLADDAQEALSRDRPPQEWLALVRHHRREMVRQPPETKIVDVVEQAVEQAVLQGRHRLEPPVRPLLTGRHLDANTRR